MEFIFVLFFLIAIISVFARRAYQRYHSPGEETDYRNIADYGKPAKSLYTSTELFSLHHRIEITDENGNVAYRAETQFPSIHDVTDIYKADGRHVSHIERKLFSLHETRYIDMDNGTRFQLSNELFHFIRDVTNIEGLGWILEGNLLQLNFTLKDAQGNLIATVGQKTLSISNKYSVDIYRPEHEETIVSILVALQHMLRDRESSSSSGASASNS